MTTLRTCPWYVRWYHRALRRADERFLAAALIRKSPMRGPQAFEDFKMEERHWQCLCAIAEEGEKEKRDGD